MKTRFSTPAAIALFTVLGSAPCLAQDALGIDLDPTMVSGAQGAETTLPGPAAPWLFVAGLVGVGLVGRRREAGR